MSGPAARLTMRGRKRAETLMVDECEIRRPPVTTGPVDDETGDRETVEGELVYSGKCKVQTYEPFESTPQSGQHVYTVQRYSLHVPAGTPAIQVNDEVTLTASALSATAETGRRFRVAGLLHKSFATAQRLLVDEITA